MSNKGDKYTEAKANIPWVYDLTSIFGDDKDFKTVTDKVNGILTDGTKQTGRYTINNGIVTIWPDLDYLNDNSEVSCSIVLDATLNETQNTNVSEHTYEFPGRAEITIHYKRKEITSSKKVGAYANGLTTTQAGGQSVTVVENEDGTYTLYYEIHANPNQNMYNFTIQDVLGDGQTLDTSSIQVFEGGTEVSPIVYTANPTSNGFTLDLAQTVKSLKDDNDQPKAGVKAWTDYFVRYQATVTKEQLGSEKTNTATYNFDGSTKTESTTVTPEFTKELNPSSCASSIIGSANLRKETTNRNLHRPFWILRMCGRRRISSLSNHPPLFPSTLCS